MEKVGPGERDRVRRVEILMTLVFVTEGDDECVVSIVERGDSETLPVKCNEKVSSVEEECVRDGSAERVRKIELDTVTEIDDCGDKDMLGDTDIDLDIADETDTLIDGVIEIEKRAVFEVDGEREPTAEGDGESLIIVLRERAFVGELILDIEFNEEDGETAILALCEDVAKTLSVEENVEKPLFVTLLPIVPVASIKGLPDERPDIETAIAVFVYEDDRESL